MPELPEVETVRRGLLPAMKGRRFAVVRARRRDLRRPLPRGFTQALTGARVTDLTRRSKYILAHLDTGRVLVIHLGMSGRVTVYKRKAAAPRPGPHDHVIFEMTGGPVIYYTDPRRFGAMDLVGADELESHRLFRALGPEPLGNQFSAPVLAAALKGKTTPIKAALMDQRVVAGLGNIYVSEALFHAGLSPKRQAGTVQGGRAEKLVRAIRRVLTAAIEAGGSSLRDHRQATGELGYFQHNWAVYGREGEACPGCTCDPAKTGGIRRITQGGRSTFYCATQQR